MDFLPLTRLYSARTDMFQKRSATRSLLTRYKYAAGILALTSILAGYAHAEPVAPNAVGVYTALIGSTNSTFSQTGFVTLALTANGALSGRISLGASTYSLKTALKYGSATANVSGHAVDLAFDSGAPSISGSISSGATALAFTAAYVPYSKLNPAPQAGAYSLLLVPTQSQTSSGGDGYATMTISPTGAIAISGRTGAGTPFTASSCLDASGLFPFYVVTRTPALAALDGWVQFQNIPCIGVCNGLLSLNTATGGGSTFALIGSSYIPPVTGASSLSLASVPGNAILEFGSGTNVITSLPVTLSQVGLSSTSSELSRLKLNIKTGIFSGDLKLPTSTGLFYGTTFQAQSLGAGVLIDGKSAAWVLLESSTSGTGVSTHGTSTVFGDGAGAITITGTNTPPPLTITGSNTTINNPPGGTLGSGDNGNGATLTGLPTTGGTGTLTLSGSLPTLSGTLGTPLGNTLVLTDSTGAILPIPDITNLSAGDTVTNNSNTGAITLTGANILSLTGSNSVTIPPDTSWTAP